MRTELHELVRMLMINFITLTLSVSFTVYFHHYQTKKNDESIARSVLYEITYNLKQIHVTELLDTANKSNLLKSQAWDSFVGTDFFNNLPSDTQKGLISFYDVIHFKQTGTLKDKDWKTLGGKADSDTAIGMSDVLNHWTEPFFDYMGAPKEAID